HDGFLYMKRLRQSFLDTLLSWRGMDDNQGALMRRVLLFVLLLLIQSTSHATTHTTASFSLTDVNAYSVAGANSKYLVDGASVLISGSGSPCHWSSGISITKAITLRGVTDCTLDGNGRPTSCGVKIVDDTSGGALISVSLVANKTTRIAHLDLVSGTGGNYQG